MLPQFVAPMAAGSAKEPFDSPDWIFESKLDGYRAIVVIDSTGKARLWSRDNLPLEPKFPTIHAALYLIRELPRSPVYDLSAIRQVTPTVAPPSSMIGVDKKCCSKTWSGFGIDNTRAQDPKGFRLLFRKTGLESEVNPNLRRSRKRVRSFDEMIVLRRSIPLRIRGGDPFLRYRIAT